MKECIIHPECVATVKVNDVEICYECWNNANAEEREWYKKVTAMYSRGLITRDELDGYLLEIGCHQLDPTIPIFI